MEGRDAVQASVLLQREDTATLAGRTRHQDREATFYVEGGIKGVRATRVTR